MDTITNPTQPQAHTPEHRRGPGEEFKARVDGLAEVCSRLIVHKREALCIVDLLREPEMVQLHVFLIKSVQSAREALSNIITTATKLVVYLRRADTAQILTVLRESISAAARSRGNAGHQGVLEEFAEIFQCEQKTDAYATALLLDRLLRAERTYVEAEWLDINDLLKLINDTKTELHKVSDIKEQRAVTMRDCIARLEGLNNYKANTSVPDVSNKLTDDHTTRLSFGRNAEIRRGTLKSGPAVALKVLPKSYDKSGNLSDSWLWFQHRHTNIVPFLGNASLREIHLCHVMPYLKHGDCLQFLCANPLTPRLPLLEGVLQGLCFLHTSNPQMLHLDLRAENILISDEGNPLLSGLLCSASNASLDDWDFRWTALEVQEGANPDVKATIWSFGMVVIEILTSKQPYYDLPTGPEMFTAVLKGKRPAKPVEEITKHGLSDRLWSFIELCWNSNPKQRPSAACLVKVVNQNLAWNSYQSLELSSMDITQLCSTRVQLPPPCAGGAFGEIRKCSLVDGSWVAVKTLKIPGLGAQAIPESKRFQREVTIWSQLGHKNILPFLGLADFPHLSKSLVSTWVDNGNCHDYLLKTPDVDRLPLVNGIAQGLQYLHTHSPAVIHGDLRGHNILILKEGHPLICDFGLAIITEDLARMPISSALQGAGNWRWMSTELVLGEASPSLESDMWSFAAVVIELFSCKIPFYDLQSWFQGIDALKDGRRPQKPGIEADKIGFSEELWELVQRCWDNEPSKRPSATEALSYIESLLQRRVLA